MPLDDSEFESYLRRFRPISPEKLVVKRSPEPARNPQFWLLCGGAAAVILVAIWFVARVRTSRPIYDIAYRDTTIYVEPLTAGRADAELRGASSTKEVLDRMAFPLSSRLASDQQSAFSVLGKEKIKL